MLTTLVKAPGEKLLATARFDRVVAWPGPVAIVRRALVAEVAPLVAGGPVRIAPAGDAAELMLAGGTDGERYLVTIGGETVGGEHPQAEVEVIVLDHGWQTPDGGAPWLSIDAFVRRVGIEEVVRATDPDGSGRIDRDLLVNALVDAQAIAEAHVAGRYALPLASVPRILAMAIADLARARLYPRGVPEPVEKAATAATKLLEGIGTGRVSLGLPASAAPAAPASDAPVLVAPGRRTYPDGLGDY